MTTLDIPEPIAPTILPGAAVNVLVSEANLLGGVADLRDAAAKTADAVLAGDVLTGERKRALAAGAVGEAAARRT